MEQPLIPATNLRIAYVIPMDLAKQLGIQKKVRMQMTHWRRQGHQTRLFTLSARPEAIDLPDLFLAQERATLRSRWHAVRAIADAVRNWQPDVVYLRYNLYYAAIASLGKTFPLVIEANTLELQEYRRQSKFKYAYARLLRPLSLKRIAGAIGVTDEISNTYAHLGVPVRTIANGIDSEAIMFLPPPNNRHPRLFFVGTPGCVWHGIDKIRQLATAFPDWQFDIVGMDAPGAESPNMKFHGILVHEQYLRILANADVAIGSLALHRIGLNEACPLKSREYLAHGLPVILAFRETDFPTGSPFLLQLPNCEDNILPNLWAIEEFVKRWMGRRVSASDIQAIFNEPKERKRVDFFQHCIEESLN